MRVNHRAEGHPLWFSLACFTALVFAMNAVMAWMRLASGSLWTAALLHASHNLIVQGIFDAGTSAGPVSPLYYRRVWGRAGGYDWGCGVGIVAEEIGRRDLNE